LWRPPIIRRQHPNHCHGDQGRAEEENEREHRENADKKNSPALPIGPNFAI
jgi:hypothetical protein